MTVKSNQQAVAFAAIFQAAALVEQLARTGDIAPNHFEPLVTALFNRSPQQFGDVYPNPNDTLPLGISVLDKICQRNSNALSADITRYAISILHLEKKLSKNPAMLNTLAEGIDNCQRQAQHFNNLHENTIAALANTYKQTLSSLSYRIRVTGNPTYLQNNHTANKVRTLLLAGIRAAILWRQVGGRRWQLITSRRYVLSLQEIQANRAKL